MTFNLNIMDLPKLTRIDGEKRHYVTPSGEKYPSVTTVISHMSDKSALFAWRKRVGEEAANKISSRATRRGTSVHSLCENFILNKEIDFTKEQPLNIMMFNQLKKFLSENVDNIRSSEGSLFSHKLKVAGSVDLVADYKGSKAIIDFKTSTTLKRKEWIENYFIQCAMYSYMLYEMTNEFHPTIVVAIAVEDNPNPQIFVEPVSKWIPKAQKMCNDYHKIT